MNNRNTRRKLRDCQRNPLIGKRFQRWRRLCHLKLSFSNLVKITNFVSKINDGKQYIRM